MQSCLKSAAVIEQDWSELLVQVSRIWKSIWDMQKCLNWISLGNVDETRHTANEFESGNYFRNDKFMCVDDRAGVEVCFVIKAQVDCS